MDGGWKLGVVGITGQMTHASLPTGRIDLQFQPATPEPPRHRPRAVGRLVGNLAEDGFVILRPGPGSPPVLPWDPVAATTGPVLRDRLRAQLNLLGELGLRSHVAADASTASLSAMTAKLNRAVRTAAISAAKEIAAIVAEATAAGFTLEVVPKGRIAADGWILGIAWDH